MEYSKGNYIKVGSANRYTSIPFELVQHWNKFNQFTTKNLNKRTKIKSEFQTKD